MVNLKKASRSKLEVLKEMKQYGNIKSIKETHDRYAYEIYFFFNKQSIFDPRFENCLSFSKKTPQKIV